MPNHTLLVSEIVATCAHVDAGIKLTDAVRAVVKVPVLAM
jgi:hypothetical protein